MMRNETRKQVNIAKRGADTKSFANVPQQQRHDLFRAARQVIGENQNINRGEFCEDGL